MDGVGMSAGLGVVVPRDVMIAFPVPWKEVVDCATAVTKIAEWRIWGRMIMEYTKRSFSDTGRSEYVERKSVFKSLQSYLGSHGSYPTSCWIPTGTHNRCHGPCTGGLKASVLVNELYYLLTHATECCRGVKQTINHYSRLHRVPFVDSDDEYLILHSSIVSNWATKLEEEFASTAYLLINSNTRYIER